MKICPRCKEEKPLSEFYKNKRNKDGLQHACKVCKSVYDSKYYKENIDKTKYRKDRLAWKAQAREKAREFVESYKEDKGCHTCNESDPLMIDFHHMNSEDKEFTISSKIQSGLSIEKIQKEIDKCVCLCVKCHRRVHADKLTILGH